MPSELHLTDALQLDLSESHNLDLRYDGDLVLGTTFGRQLGAVHVSGDLHLDLDLVSGTIVSEGTLTSDGDIDATRLTARVLDLRGGVIRARALAATERIILGAATLKVDVIIAPEILIDPEASGRVTVIESQNERSPNKIKGGFSLEEYEELFGDAVLFLEARGVSPLRELEQTLPPHSLDPDALTELDSFEDMEPEPLEEIEPEPLDELEPEPLPEIAVEPLGEVDDEYLVEIEPEPLDEDLPEIDSDSVEPIDDVDTVLDADDTLLHESIEDEDAGIIEGASIRPMLPPRAPTPQRTIPRAVAPESMSQELQAWYARVDRLVRTVDDAYEFAPGPVMELRTVTESRRPDALAEGLALVWLDLVRHHVQSRAPLAPKVAHSFRVLNDLVSAGAPQ